MPGKLVFFTVQPVSVIYFQNKLEIFILTSLIGKIY